MLTQQKPIYRAGNETPVRIVGIVAAVLLAAGLLPPYGELWKRKGRVIGINWVSVHLLHHLESHAQKLHGLTHDRSF